VNKGQENAMSTARRPSNTQLQGQARKVSALMRSYVNFHYGYIQEDFPDWRETSAGLLDQAAGALVKLRALDSQDGPLRDGLRGTAYERAGCRELPGEDLAQARRRGAAAEAAADLAEALRAGDLKLATQLHRELADRLPQVNGLL
jgi:hypothetical protein